MYNVKKSNLQDCYGKEPVYMVFQNAVSLWVIVNDDNNGNDADGDSNDDDNDCTTIQIYVFVVMTITLN